MTNPLNSFSTNFGRFYAHPSAGLVNAAGVPFEASGEGPYHPKPSITNIIGMIDKKFLPGYYAKLVAEYAVKNVGSINYWLDKFGENAAVGNLKAATGFPNKNAAIGDEIHAAIDADCNGESPLLTSLTATRMFEQWKHFRATVPIEIIRSEYTVWSYKHGYAGTGDLMWHIPQGFNIPPGMWIVDTKSGNQVYPEVALQTTASAHADVIIGADGSESEMIPSDVQGVMHIRPRSIKLYQLHRTDEAWETFLAAKRIFDWKRFDADLVIQDDPFVTQFVKESK